MVVSTSSFGAAQALKAVAPQPVPSGAFMGNPAAYGYMPVRLADSYLPAQTEHDDGSCIPTCFRPAETIVVGYAQGHMYPGGQYPVAQPPMGYMPYPPPQVPSTRSCGAPAPSCLLSAIVSRETHTPLAR